MTRTRRPTGITAQTIAAIAVIDDHWLHSGLTLTEWAILWAGLTGVVAYFNPLPK